MPIPGRTPRRTGGRNTLDAVAFAFYVLNEKYSTADGTGKKPRIIRPANTVVIASSVSNGAGAALMAAEQDSLGLIDGVAVSEPQIRAEGRRRHRHQAGQRQRAHRRQAAPRLLHLRQPLPALRRPVHGRRRRAARRRPRPLRRRPLRLAEGQRACSPPPPSPVRPTRRCTSSTPTAGPPSTTPSTPPTTPSPPPPSSSPTSTPSGASACWTTSAASASPPPPAPARSSPPRPWSSR